MNFSKKIGFLIFVGCVPFLFNGCKKDTAVNGTKTIVEHDTVQHAWNQEPATYYFTDQNITNAYSYSNGKIIFTCSEGGFFIYDSVQKQWSSGYSSIVGQGFGSMAHRIPIYKDYILETRNDKFEVHNPFYLSSRPTFQFNQLDTSLKGGCVSIPFSIFENDVDINDSGRVIFPVKKSATTIPAFLLLDVKYNGSGNFDTSNKKTITIGNTGSFYSVSGHIKNNFFVVANDSTFLIKPDYSVTYVSQDMLYGFFKYNSNYYALGPNQGAIYQSTDYGQTWTKLFTVSPNSSALGILNFDNKLLALYNDQLFLVTIQAMSLTFKEIVNDGLKGKIITSVSKCDNKVYVSTTQGIYYRSYASFYQYK